MRLAIASMLNSYIRGMRRLFTPPTAAELWEDEVCRRDPIAAVDTYERMARECLQRGAPSVHWLRRLCSNPVMLPLSANAALGLLRDHPDLDEDSAWILLPFVLNNNHADGNSKLLSDMLTCTAALPHEHVYLLWLAVAIVLEPGRHEAAVASAAASASAGLIEALDLVCDMRALRPKGLDKLNVDAIGNLANFVVNNAPVGQLSSFVSHAHRVVKVLIDLLTKNPDPAAGNLLLRMAKNEAFVHFSTLIEMALPRQRTLSVDSHHQQFSWPLILTRLRNGPPSSVEDLQALVMDHMRKIQMDVAGSALNIHKWFWNEDPHGRATKEKCENSARDVLMGLLAYRLAPYEVHVEPEVSMRDSKRVDIALSYKKLRLVIELKRDSHADLRTAIEGQLDGYTRHPEASGRGIFGVFWYGKTITGSSETLCNELRMSIAPGMSERIKVFVLDVSVPDPSSKAPNSLGPKRAPAKKSAGNKVHASRPAGTT